MTQRVQVKKEMAERVRPMMDSTRPAVFLAVGGADDPHDAAGHGQSAEDIWKA